MEFTAGTVVRSHSAATCLSRCGSDVSMTILLTKIEVLTSLDLRTGPQDRDPHTFMGKMVMMTTEPIFNEGPRLSLDPIVP